ncbi:MAG: hypothetical protein HQL82_15090 [Magnetococcales bacterium]|nr:hypothetical protein [Magnetococcales bacterium]
MQAFTIKDFWQRRLPGYSGQNLTLIPGWQCIRSGLNTFVEAPLESSSETENAISADSSPLILVSAPGAVGKSTLARQIAFNCWAIYLDLAVAAPVGGNTISGGIYKCGLSASWQGNAVAIMIDGLDEARLRVTQEAYEAFLGDVADLSINRSVPTVLFGRTGAVQDAYLAFALRNVSVPILEIGYYNSDSAVEFAMARIRDTKPDRASEQTERIAVSGLINGLRNQTHTDGNRFAGYAPVLQAVADCVRQSTNPQAVVSDIESGNTPVGLEKITTAILNRERSKLDSLAFSNPSVAGTLYLQDEQLHRLAARIYGVTPPEAPRMSPKDAEIYNAALETWVGEHPFLDGTSQQSSSSVFDAVISAWAIKNGDQALSNKVLLREIARGVAANPFFSEFYKTETEDGLSNFMNPSHVGIFYNSLRAGLSLGENASLIIGSDEDAEEPEEALRAEIEITLTRRGEESPHILSFVTDQTNPILLGPHVENVDVSTRYATVSVGSGAEATFVSPVTIQCANLQIMAERVIVEKSTEENRTVNLEADTFDGDRISVVPILRGDVDFSVSWPGSRAYPWTAFASEPTQITDPREQEALRRFRKFIISFRSHSKGSLARFRDKIEHARMTKGCGSDVLGALVREGVLSLHGEMYHLDPSILANITGASYHNCVRRQYSERTIDFIRSVLN